MLLIMFKLSVVTNSMVEYNNLKIFYFVLLMWSLKSQSVKELVNWLRINNVKPTCSSSIRTILHRKCAIIFAPAKKYTIGNFSIFSKHVNLCIER